MQKFSLPFLAFAIVVAFFPSAEADGSVRGGECSKRKVCSLSDVSLDDDELGKRMYVISTSVKNAGKISCAPSLKRNDYVVTRGLGAHKLQRDKVSWNEARKACMMEGANLALLDSAEKEALFRGWMDKESLAGLWLGFHDLYEEGSWTTVTGEMVDGFAYYPWAKGEPDNWNRQEHCAILWAPRINEFGADDYTCNHKAAFVCEINLCDSLGPLGLSAANSTLPSRPDSHLSVSRDPTSPDTNDDNSFG
ncbi:C-type lectin lectoxin-Thr1 [Megalopta genalis]|uniref:C-type lectin lectoxin-Thr1 n=1 Tax=Megalopta genalis TaxID=115081 RepID=UPI003FD21553